MLKVAFDTPGNSKLKIQDAYRVGLRPSAEQKGADEGSSEARESGVSSFVLDLPDWGSLACGRGGWILAIQCSHHATNSLFPLILSMESPGSRTLVGRPGTAHRNKSRLIANHDCRHVLVDMSFRWRTTPRARLR